MMQPKYQLRLSRDDIWHMDRPHFHEDVEILLSLSEGGDFFIGNQLYPLHEGELFLLGEATLHKSVSPESYKRYVMHISPNTLRELSTPQSDFPARIRNAGRRTLLSRESTQELVRLFKRLEQPCGKQFGSDLEQTIVLLHFLLKVFSFFDETVSDKAALTPGFARITPILDYIQENISQPLTLDSISSHFFINKYHLCHTFKTATGFSVMEYIINCRVLKARELLRGGMRVQEVGEAVGFRNNEHFIRTFRNMTGTSPKRYAKEYLAGDKI